LKYYEYDVTNLVKYFVTFFEVFIPQLSLALEYQGETHYFTTHIFGRASDRQRADHLKRQFSKQIGITLLSIPFWWDKSPNSLASTIRTQRPDIDFRSSIAVPPIPTEIPLPSRRRFEYLPNQATDFKDQFDPTGWLIMDKFDGVRVFWDGKRLHSKSSGVKIEVPRSLQFPATPFEGELW
jgi:hypothetical protein